MKKVFLTLVFLGVYSIVQAGCFQAIRQCGGTWTHLVCVGDRTAHNCSAFACESCTGKPTINQ